MGRAIGDLNNKSAVLNDNEALQQKGDPELTAAAMQFVKNFDTNSFAFDNIEISVVKVPVSIVSMQL